MSKNAVKAAFEKQIVVLPLDIIVPQKEVTKNHRSGEYYRHISGWRDVSNKRTHDPQSSKELLEVPIRTGGFGVASRSNFAPISYQPGF